MLLGLLAHLRRAFQNAWSHDVLLVAKAAAYSAVLSVFPALLVLAAVIAFLPAAQALRHDLYRAMVEILPDEDAVNLLVSYFHSSPRRTLSSLASASFISWLAGSGVSMSLMEGFRRAYRFPHGYWNIWNHRVVAFALVPLSLVPLSFAAAIVIFGHFIAEWMLAQAGHDVRFFVLLFWMMIRWTVAVLTSIAMLSTIYHLGTPRTRSWPTVLPGAILATAIWFPTTLLFGWYVTRFADYGAIYGSLGAGIALLVWLYILCITVLIGAEFNAEMYPRHMRTAPAAPVQEKRFA